MAALSVSKAFSIAKRKNPMLFLNRTRAGLRLGQELKSLQLADPIVLAIPRGGVPVGAAAARELACPFDVIPLVKIPIPWTPEASYGAVAPDGAMALNLPLVHRLEVSLPELELAARHYAQKATRLCALYRGDGEPPTLEGRTVLLVDDGLASGYSMLASVLFVRKKKPAAVIVAAPVASETAARMIGQNEDVDRAVFLVRDAEQVFALPHHYKEFGTVTDEDVVRIMKSR